MNGKIVRYVLGIVGSLSLAFGIVGYYMLNAKSNLLFSITINSMETNASLFENYLMFCAQYRMPLLVLGVACMLAIIIWKQCTKAQKQ